MNQSIIVSLQYLRVAPRKTRLIASALKGLSLQEAEAQLLMRSQRSAPALLKLLRSAAANARQQNINENSLIIKSIRVDKGPMLKRVLPRAMGRATTLQKKMSHIIVTLEQSEKLKSPRFVIIPRVSEKHEDKNSSRLKKKRKGASDTSISSKKSSLKHSHKDNERAEDIRGSAQSESQRSDKFLKTDSKPTGVKTDTNKSAGFIKKMFRRKSV